MTCLSRLRKRRVESDRARPAESIDSTRSNNIEPPSAVSPARPASPVLSTHAATSLATANGTASGTASGTDTLKPALRRPGSMASLAGPATPSDAAQVDGPDDANTDRPTDGPATAGPEEDTDVCLLCSRAHPLPHDRFHDVCVLAQMAVTAVAPFLVALFGQRIKPRIRAFATMFPVWLWHSWVDIVTILVTTTLALFLYYQRPPANRSFAVTNSQGDVVYPQFAFPLRREILPAWLSILLGPIVPVVLIVLLQVRVQSIWDANNAVFGMLYSLSSSVIVQVILKWLIGGLRPHFLDVCKPDLSLAPHTEHRYNGVGFGQMYYTRDICTGNNRDINDSLTSFPSGHTTGAFSGLVFLSLYMNAKFKIFANRHTPMWKQLLFNAPILLAALVGGALTIDAFHNWYDVVAGALIGTFSALTAFRMAYASVFDYRYNHIPLNRVHPFDYATVADADALADGFGLTRLDNSRLPTCFHWGSQ